MTLGAGCPRCPSAVTAEGGGWTCPQHGGITPLWRPDVADYDSFAEHLGWASGLATLVPWPLPPGWRVGDFGCVAGTGREARASLVTCTGGNDVDGVVEVTVVSEEPGVGLGARCAGVHRTDPGAEIDDDGRPLAKVRIGGRPVPLWPVPTSEADLSYDRSVFAGEAQGRWLWLVLRPASAGLLLADEWVLHDLGDLGPELVDVPFGGAPSAW